MNFRKNSGITLVALVVTIIVLIILAGVSIGLLLGENGIITKAREAKNIQELAEIKEKLGLDIIAAQMDAINRNETLEQSQLEDIISNYGVLQDDKNTIILGPTAAAIFKQNNLYRFQIILKYKKDSKMRETLITLNNLYKQNKKTYLEIDNNPLKI